jgi:hypothetical protein
MVLMPNVVTIPAMALSMFAILCETTLEEDHWLEHRREQYQELMDGTDRFLPLKGLGRVLGIGRTGPTVDRGEELRR